MDLLTIIIVNFRSADLTIDCIRSLLRYNPTLTGEIIVVDNDSGDDSRARIIEAFPFGSSGLPIIWSDMGYNAGFARANNRGMEAAKGSIFLLLNPDTLSIDDSITRSVGKLNGSSFVACGVQQLYKDGSLQISGNFFMKGGLNLLISLPYWGQILRGIAFRTGVKVPHVSNASDVEEVDWISGAFLMVKKIAVERAGMMDEDFFLYAEEVEWCSRLCKVGKLCVFGQERIIHLQGKTVEAEYGFTANDYFGVFSRKDFQLMVSNHLRVRKQFGVGWFLFLLVNYSLGVPIYFFGSFIHRLFTFRNPFLEWGLAAKFAWNVAGLWILSPRMIVNKPYFYKVL